MADKMSMEEMKMLMGISQAMGKLDGQFEGQAKDIKANKDNIETLFTKTNTLEKKEVRISTKMMKSALIAAVLSSNLNSRKSLLWGLLNKAKLLKLKCH